MRWIVCYDVGCDKSRRLIHQTLLGYGTAIEESVFECEVTDAEMAGLLREVRDLLDEEEDRCHAFPVCRDCSGKAEVLGQGKRLVRLTHYVV
jgi:CRISPR-associated endonuclease Cas2